MVGSTLPPWGEVLLYHLEEYLRGSTVVRNFIRSAGPFADCYLLLPTLLLSVTNPCSSFCFPSETTNVLTHTTTPTSATATITTSTTSSPTLTLI